MVIEDTARHAMCHAGLAGFLAFYIALMCGWHINELFVLTLKSGAMWSGGGENDANLRSHALVRLNPCTSLRWFFPFAPIVHSRNKQFHYCRLSLELAQSSSLLRECNSISWKYQFPYDSLLVSPTTSLQIDWISFLIFYLFLPSCFRLHFFCVRSRRRSTSGEVFHFKYCTRWLACSEVKWRRETERRTSESGNFSIALRWKFLAFT